jgi:hypothetical protein
MFNIYLGIYIVISIFIIGGGVATLFKSDRMMSAILYLAGSLAIFSIFGIRWFGSDTSLFSEAPVSWPPNINTCPDYLMYFKRKKQGGEEDTCVDTIGVSKNGSLKVFTDSMKQSPPESDDYYFSLQTKSSDQTQRNQELCQRAITYGLTWEGITNGESCMSNGQPTPPPVPPSSCPQ